LQAKLRGERKGDSGGLSAQLEDPETGGLGRPESLLKRKSRGSRKLEKKAEQYFESTLRQSKTNEKIRGETEIDPDQEALFFSGIDTP
jgi:hypothetical protein